MKPPFRRATPQASAEALRKPQPRIDTRIAALEPLADVIQASLALDAEEPAGARRGARAEAPRVLAERRHGLHRPTTRRTHPANSRAAARVGCGPEALELSARATPFGIRRNAEGAVAAHSDRRAARDPHLCRSRRDRRLDEAAQQRAARPGRSAARFGTRPAPAFVESRPLPGGRGPRRCVRSVRARRCRGGGLRAVGRARRFRGARLRRRLRRRTSRRSTEPRRRHARGGGHRCQGASVTRSRKRRGRRRPSPRRGVLPRRLPALPPSATPASRRRRVRRKLRSLRSRAARCVSPPIRRRSSASKAMGSSKRARHRFAASRCDPARTASPFATKRTVRPSRRAWCSSRAASAAFTRIFALRSRASRSVEPRAHPSFAPES